MSREAFEKFYKEKVDVDAVFGRNENGQYRGAYVQYAWFVWQAAQAQAGQPIAAVHGWFHGECVIRALDPEAVLPAGMALYSQPQAQAGDAEAVGYVYHTSGGAREVSWFDSDGIEDDALLYTAPPAEVKAGDGESEYGRGYYDGRKSNIDQVPAFWYEALEKIAQEYEELFIYYKDEREKDGWDSPEYPQTLLEVRELLKGFNPAPPAAKANQQLLTEWLEREMPPGTVISDPAWWAPRIIKAIAAAQEQK